MNSHDSEKFYFDGGMYSVFREIFRELWNMVPHGTCQSQRI